MKKVWVNRFNADGSMKPVNEWELKEVPAHFKKVTTYVDPEKAAREIAADTCLDAFFTQETKSEDVSDQHGDGWFYIADGDLPPYLVGDVLVSFWDGEFDVVLSKDVHDRKLDELMQAWQPITLPKYMNTLPPLLPTNWRFLF